MQISLVVPVYNEQHNVPEFITRLLPTLEAITSDFKIIFALGSFAGSNGRDGPARPRTRSAREIFATLASRDTRTETGVHSTTCSHLEFQSLFLPRDLTLLQALSVTGAICSVLSESIHAGTSRPMAVRTTC